MSSPIPLPEPVELRRSEWFVGVIAVTLAGLLSKLSPSRLERVLKFLKRGSRGSCYARAARARNIVTSISLRCAGEGCVQRSIASVIICRLQGVWPTWNSGVRTKPFRAHAWISVDGRPVEEPESTSSFTPLISI